MLGQNPLNVYAEMIRGCFRSKIAIQSTVKIGIPLLVTSLGVTPVSYTHLDVYKRQALCGARHAFPRPDPGGQPRPDQGGG